MDAKKLKTAVEEARRFIAKADAYQTRVKNDTWLTDWQGCRESGACRRASLDLSRALSDLRR